MKKLLFLPVILFVPICTWALQVPVFVPDSGFYVAHPSYERIGDMAFGKNTFALLETNQDAVISVGIGVREVVPLQIQDARYIAYGNGMFVVAGSKGNFAHSKDLIHWFYVHWDGQQVVPGPKETSGIISINDILSFTYLPEHQHFFAETSNGKVLISQNGAEWSVWQDGTSTPKKAYPQISDTLVVFEHTGNYLKFERESIKTDTWQVFESSNGTTWTSSGTMVTGATPTKAYKRNTWVGHAGGGCFLKVGSNWVVEQYGGVGGNIPAKASQGRFHQYVVAGIKNGMLGQFWGDRWDLHQQVDAEDIVFDRELNRFFLLGFDKVFSSYDGTRAVPVFENTGFYASDAVGANRRLLIAGRDWEHHPAVFYSVDRISDLQLLDTAGNLAFSDAVSGIDWTSYPYPENAGSPRIASFDGAFYLATGYHLYRSTDGTDWEKVYETEEYSWITALYVYRNKLWVGTTNYFQANHIYTPPPEGVDPKNAVYASADGDIWSETEVQSQIYLDEPSLEGPKLMEFLYGFPSSTVTLADGGESIARVYEPWGIIEGTLVWAWGRYYLLNEDSTAKTAFQGFRDASYYAQLESGISPQEVVSNTGYLGNMSSNTLHGMHQTLGEVEIVEDAISDSKLYLLSDQFGVVEFFPQKSPYCYSPMDGTTYYINFYTSAYAEDEGAVQRYYNHTTGEWAAKMTSESFGFEEWYQKTKEQTDALQVEANWLLQLDSATGSAADGWRRYQRFQVQHRIQEQVWRCAYLSLSEDPTEQNDQSQRLLVLNELSESLSQQVSNHYETQFVNLVEF